MWEVLVRESTLLHTLGGLDQPSSGEVFIKGQSLQKASESELAKLRNQNLGFVYQFHHLMADFTALENVMMPMLIGRQNKTEAKDRAEKNIGCSRLKSFALLIVHLHFRAVNVNVWRLLVH